MIHRIIEGESKCNVSAPVGWVPFRKNQVGCIRKLFYFNDRKEPTYPFIRTLAGYTLYEQQVRIGRFLVYPNTVAFVPERAVRLWEFPDSTLAELSILLKPYGWSIHQEPTDNEFYFHQMSIGD